MFHHIITQYAALNLDQHGSFGGPGKDGDGYFAFGSDDFRGYLWKLPSSSALEEQRQLVDKDDWATNDWPDIIGEYTRARFLIRPVPYFQVLEAFTGANSEVKCIPVELSTPLCHLNGMCLLNSRVLRLKPI